MTFRQQILSAIAMFAVAVGLPIQVVAADSQFLTGSAASDLIRMTLAEQNLDGDPVIADDRVFPNCDGTISVQPMFGGWTTVRLQCNADRGWKFAIRTNLTTTAVPVPIKDFKPNQMLARKNDGPIQRATSRLDTVLQDEIDVVALAKSVARGDVITANDVILVTVPARNVGGGFFNPQDVIGRRMKSSLAAHRPVQARHLLPDFMVEQDTEVVIMASAGGISVDMLGFALENGQIGDWIKVQNASSGKTVRAKIIAEKKVAVIAKKG